MRSSLNHQSKALILSYWHVFLAMQWHPNYLKEQSSWNFSKCYNVSFLMANLLFLFKVLMREGGCRGAVALYDTKTSDFRYKWYPQKISPYVTAILKHVKHVWQN